MTAPANTEILDRQSLGSLMGYELAKRLPVTPVRVPTPLGESTRADDLAFGTPTG